jgi:TPR repeat protein
MRCVRTIGTCGLLALAFATIGHSGPVLAASGSFERMGRAMAAPIIRVNFTDGSEFQWRPRPHLQESWVLGSTADDPDDFQRVYERATMFGDAISQLRLGLKFYKGDGVEQDFAAAAKWLRLSAQQGNHTAQAILGYQYYSGAGVPRDLVEANLWVTLALSSLPDGRARDSVSALKDAIETELTVEERSVAEQRVQDWYAGMTTMDFPLTR